MMREGCRTDSRVERGRGEGPVVVGFPAEGTSSGLSVDDVSHSRIQRGLNCVCHKRVKY